MKSKEQLLDLGKIKCVQFNRTQVYKELVRINNGGKVNAKLAVKMLLQLHYIMAEYESLRFITSSEARQIIETAKRHLNITKWFYSDKWGAKLIEKGSRK